MGDANFNLEVVGEGFILKAKTDPDPQVLWSSQEPEDVFGEAFQANTANTGEVVWFLNIVVLFSNPRLFRIWPYFGEWKEFQLV